MDNQRLLERKQDFILATKRLAEACEQPFTSFIRDSVIQRFEFCWELGWKTLKLRLEELGVEVLNPRDTLKEALNKGLIHDGNAWTEGQRYRNLTTHTYDEKLADQVYHYVMQQGLSLFQQLAEAVTSW
jgi:nucleotidyltransferase substrate binding protein (TIGR01987 family)